MLLLCHSITVVRTDFVHTNPESRSQDKNFLYSVCCRVPCFEKNIRATNAFMLCVCVLLRDRGPFHV